MSTASIPAKPIPVTPAEFLIHLRDKVAELRRIRAGLDNVLLGAGWIVANTGVHYAFDVEGGKATNPRVVSVERATRFSERDAQAVAASVKNGADNPGHAVHIRDALDAQIAEYDNLAKALESQTA